MNPTTIAASKSTVQTKRLCTACERCLPLENFRRQRKGSEKRRSQCNECRRKIERKQRSAPDREILRDVNRELRKSRIHRMAAIMEGLVDRFGGMSKFVKRYWELVEEVEGASPSYKLRAYQTVFKMLSSVDEWQANEKALQMKERIEQIRAGRLKDANCKLSDLSDAALLEALSEQIRSLYRCDLLAEVLRQMKKRGEFEGERLQALRDAVA